MLKIGSWYAATDQARRLAAAQLAAWFAGAAPLVALGYLFAEVALGHPGDRGRLVVTPTQVAGGAAWMVALAAAGVMIGRGRRAGLVLAAALFAAVLAAQWRVPIVAAGAVIGLALVARAWR